jgi:hypothetical protein
MCTFKMVTLFPCFFLSLFRLRLFSAPSSPSFHLSIMELISAALLSKYLSPLPCFVFYSSAVPSRFKYLFPVISMHSVLSSCYGALPPLPSFIVFHSHPISVSIHSPILSYPLPFPICSPIPCTSSLPPPPPSSPLHRTPPVCFNSSRSYPLSTSASPF